MEYNENKLSDGALLKSFIREDLTKKCGPFAIYSGLKYR